MYTLQLNALYFEFSGIIQIAEFSKILSRVFENFRKKISVIFSTLYRSLFDVKCIIRLLKTQY